MKTPLRDLSKAVLVVMAILCLSTAAFAEEEVAGADFNDGTMHWSISTDGVLTITGTGDMPDYTSSTGSPWYDFRDYILSIVVDDGITKIGDGTFCHLDKMVSISLSNSVTALGDNCFYDCKALGSIAIPEGVTDLSSDNIFQMCSSLSEVHLPASLTKISGSYVFSGSPITKIYYSGTLAQWLSYDLDDITNYPCNLYIGGERLENLTIPSSITTIRDGAFENIKLNSVTIPEQVTSISDFAFMGSSVSNVVISSSVTNVGMSAFTSCSSLKRVYFVGDQATWDNITFSSGNDALIDASRYYIDSFDDIRTVTVGAVENGSVTVSDVHCILGDVINVSATPEPGWRLKCIIVNGEPIEGSSFVAEEGVDYVVSAEFEFYMAVKDSGSCGTNLTWTLYDNNELVISGTGEMFDGYYYGNAPWYNYRAIIKSVVINEGVTSVGNSAFQNCTALSSVELPDSLEYIGSNAFEECISLTSFELPSGIKSIDYGVFNGCTIESLYFKGSINDWLRIESMNWGFLECVDSLYISGELVENLVIPDGVKSIPNYAFKGYGKLKSVVIPASVTTIGDNAFFSRNLVYAEFLGNAPNIGANAFYGGDGFTIYYHENTGGWSSPKWDIYYAACVEEFSDYSVLDEDNRNSQGILFTLNESAKTAVVGDGSGETNNSGYYGAQRGAVVIPNTVTKDGAIYQVIGIGSGAFKGNRHVTSVSIGSGVTSILPDAFAGCPELKSITVSDENQYYSSVDGVLYDAGEMYLYVYPGGKTDDSFTVPDTVQTIGMYAFYDNEHIRSLTVGRNVTAIYEEAFCGLTNLTEITLPFIGTQEEMGDNYNNNYYRYGAFGMVFGDGTYGLNGLYDWYGTEYGGSLKTVTILGGELYERSFRYYCGFIDEINLPAIPSEIPEYCFSECISLQKLTFAGNPCETGSLVLPEGVESIGQSAFYGCEGITSVTLPASLTSIESGAFSGAGIEEFAVAAGNQSFSTDGWGVLYNRDMTELIQYPSCRVWPYYNVADTATSIAENAFYGSNTLVNLYIPNSVVNMEYNFEGCPYLTICCYVNSAAYRYALNNSLTAWYMDNMTLRGIRVYSLPEQTVQTEGAVNLAGLYIVGDYGGRELQIDDYTLSYDDQTSGLKTVTVEYMGKTATFEMVFYTTEAGNIISFRTDEDLDGVMVMISLYNSDGAMIYCGNAAISNGEAQIGVSDDVYDAADHAKLLILDESNYTPAAAAQEISV